MKKQALLILVSVLCIASGVQAEKSLFDRKSGKRGGSQTPGTAANCTPPTASTELDINNTKALIQSGGDMWWDFNRSRYEIPKGSGKTSLFAGSLWLAGQDVSGQFKVAALRFRQIGQDYWTGPLSTINSEIDPATCKLYDRQWETSRSMVSEFAAWWEAGQFDQQNGTNTQDVLYPGYTPPTTILEWPAHGRNFDPYNEDYYLAPFFDRDGDGDYDPIGDGDYPGYVLVGKSDCSRRVRDVYGDQNIWWVFNDKGNVHTESGGQAIGMEIRAQAFAFATTDEVNNMTFYNYELINRSTFELKDTYFGQWVDGDLGNAQDDFVGCDVRRGLGYFYNGDEEDEDAGGNIGYGVNPPAIGVDFFQGPFQANDNLDNCLCEDDYQGAVDSNGIVYPGQGAGYGDGIVDNERYGMRKFLYHNNSAGATGDPAIATDYYNLLRGIWKDGTPMTHGGNGYDPTNPNAIPAGYMFPSDTDPLHWGTEGIDPGTGPWTEVTAGNTPADRRFVQSSGPFVLGPGAVNNITVGVVWAQATEGGRLASIEVMRRADDKTQALFDSCFEILDGPDAPDVTVQELDREVVLMLSNPVNSNNYQEGFERIDPFLAPPDSVDTNGDGEPDLGLTKEEKLKYATYLFEGYQVFQLADASVGTNDLDDPDKARLVAQVDIANDVTTLINYVNNSLLKIDEPFLKVQGANQGIKHSFQVTEDRFATGDNRLINNKTYYYMAVAYAYNRHGDGFGNLQYVAGLYDPTNPEALDGQKLPYLASRKAPSGPVKVYEAVPHRTEFENNGTTLNSKYGDGVELVRVEGRGNGGNELVLSDETIDRLFENGASGNWTVENARYEAGKGPIDIKVVDPLNVAPGNWTLAFEDPLGTRDPRNYTWKIYGDGVSDTIFSERSIEIDNEQILFELGLSITGSYGWGPFTDKAVNNGFIGFDILYEDEGDQWLGGLADEDANSAKNWIKSGKYLEPDPLGGQGDRAEDDHFNNYAPSVSDNAVSLDPDQIYENIAGRSWAPFCMASYDTNHPLPTLVGTAGYVLAENILKNNGFRNTPSVEIVITKDKTKWTRCPVFEAQDNGLLTAGSAVRGELRRALSVDKNGLDQLDEGFDFNEATMNGTQLLTPSMVGRLSQVEKDHYAAMGISAADLTKYSIGMGWFPGYAVNLETGERMNMAFSEDSWLAKENGADMMWNPTSRETEGLFESVRYGGKHMVYVFRNNLEQASYLDAEYLMPAYDQGLKAYTNLVGFDKTNSTSFLDSTSVGFKRYIGVFRAGAWVGYPMLNPNFKLFGASEDGNDVTIRLNCAKPYFAYSPAVDDAELNPSALQIGQGYYVKEGRIQVERRVILTGDTFTNQLATIGKGKSFVAGSTTYTNVTPNVDVELIPTINDGLPLYQFSTDELAPTFDNSIGEDALGDINVVPNPYYAYSEYETGRLDYEVKVINLPQTCNITIYTVDGTLVRTFKKDDATTSSVPWDLKNQDNIPIASGLYIIHVEVPGIGERILKWFGVLRPIDLNSF